MLTFTCHHVINLRKLFRHNNSIKLTDRYILSLFVLPACILETLWSHRHLRHTVWTVLLSDYHLKKLHKIWYRWDVFKQGNNHQISSDLYGDWFWNGEFVFLLFKSFCMGGHLQAIWRSLQHGKIPTSCSPHVIYTVQIWGDLQSWDLSRPSQPVVV